MEPLLALPAEHEHRDSVLSEHGGLGLQDHGPSEAGRLSGKARAFLLVCAAEVVLVVADGVWFELGARDEDTSDNRWYLGLMAINMCFFAYLAASSVRLESPFEFYAFLFTSLLLVMRVGWEFAWREGTCSSNGVLPLCYGTVGAVVAFEVVFFTLGVAVMRDFGWKFFREMGSSTLLREMYKTRQVLYAVLKVDAQLAASVLFTGLFYSGTRGIIVAAIVLVCEVVWQAVAYISVQGEHRRGMWAVFLGAWVLPAYALYVALYFDTLDVQGAVLSLATLALLVRAAALVLSVRAFSNFGRGLLAGQ